MAEVQILLLNDIFLSLNSLNSVKAFRKNSILSHIFVGKCLIGLQSQRFLLALMIKTKLHYIFLN